MSHITIVISRSRSLSESTDQATDITYNYEMPIPHGMTPADVGEMVRRAYRRLEGADRDDE